MHKEFREILDRVHDPKQVKSVNDFVRVAIVPALAHLEKRIENLEEAMTKVIINQKETIKTLEKIFGTKEGDNHPATWRP